MPLPTINDIMSVPNPGLVDAMHAHPPVTLQNTVHEAKWGHAAWAGNNFTVAALGNLNYWYIPAVPDRISYCVAPCPGAGGDAYVISPQYGGCEYHTLYNATNNLFAFLHVYRGGGATTQYTLAPGWVLQSVKRSAAIAGAFGMMGSNWSVSLVNRHLHPPTAQSKFIHVPGAAPLTVMGEDAGDAAYQPAYAPAPLPAPRGGFGAIFTALFGLLLRSGR